MGGFAVYFLLAQLNICCEALLVLGWSKTFAWNAKEGKLLPLDYVTIEEHCMCMFSICAFSN